MSILQATHLYKHYTTTQHGALPAIEDVSFELASGEFLCIVGPSGCGKTTLLRLLAGLLPPDQGEVRLNGHLLQEACSDIGLVFQKANLMPWRNVFDNILLPLQVQRMPKSQANERVGEVLAMVGLTDFSAAYPRELSGGMQQRVAIARALVHRPKILLLDEPFGSLDALTRERLNLELLQLWGDGRKTVAMVTHNIQEAVFLADRVLVLSQRPGRVTAAIPVTLPRPRQLSLLYDNHLNALAHKVHQAIQYQGL